MTTLNTAARRCFSAIMDEAAYLARGAEVREDLSADEALAIVQQLEELAAYAAQAIARFDGAKALYERVEEPDQELTVPDSYDDAAPLAAAEGVRAHV